MFSLGVSPGRPKREVDVGLLRALRAKGYGYKRISGEYTRVTGEYISHTTVRERLTQCLKAYLLL
jgi:hypothetical protein